LKTTIKDGNLSYSELKPKFIDYFDEKFADKLCEVITVKNEATEMDKFVKDRLKLIGQLFPEASTRSKNMLVVACAGKDFVKRFSALFHVDEETLCDLLTIIEDTKE
jgi:hypothetical protein